MRPYLERLPNVADASWSMLNRQLDDSIPFQWHHHPELELTLTLNSVGQRFIGDNVGSYGHGDLVLVGPNLPHTWVSKSKIDPSQSHVALVLWFGRDWLLSSLAGSVEMQPILNLLDRSAGGLAFSPELGVMLQDEFLAVFELPPLQRLLALLQILAKLSADQSASRLSNIIPGPASTGRSRIDRVLTHLHAHYTRPISMEELAEQAALSVSGLHRMFARHTRTSVTDYLISLRIGDACARLSSSSQPIQFIAEAVGYASLANFNRQFRALRGMTPREYRAQFQ